MFHLFNPFHFRFFWSINNFLWSLFLDGFFIFDLSFGFLFYDLVNHLFILLNNLILFLNLSLLFLFHLDIFLILFLRQFSINLVRFNGFLRAKFWKTWVVFLSNRVFFIFLLLQLFFNLLQHLAYSFFIIEQPITFKFAYRFTSLIILELLRFTDWFWTLR